MVPQLIHILLLLLLLLLLNYPCKPLFLDTRLPTVLTIKPPFSISFLIASIFAAM